jgi:hypothetical protein
MPSRAPTAMWGTTNVIVRHMATHRAFFRWISRLASVCSIWGLAFRRVDCSSAPQTHKVLQLAALDMHRFCLLFSMNGRP